MMKKIITILLVLIVMLGCMISCSAKQNNQVNFFIKGQIQEMNEVGSAILVDSVSDDASGLVWVSIKDAKFDAGVSQELKAGNYVEVEFDGVLAESYPMQAKGSKIVVNR